MLVGRDLFSHQPKSTSLPESGGLKRHWRDANNSDDNKAAGAEVNLAVARWQLALTEERSASPAQLAEGEWLPDRRQVIVPGRARFSGQFGWRQLSDGATVLQPEEALGLMELGRLIVRLGGLPLSVQQAYQTFLSSPVEFQRWLAYIKLVRVGYRLVRHSANRRVPSAATVAPVLTAESRQFVLDLSSRPRRAVDPDLPSSTGFSEQVDCSKAASWSEYRSAASATSATIPKIARELQAASFPTESPELRPLVPWQDLVKPGGLSTADALQRMSVPSDIASNSAADGSVEKCRCSVCSGQLTAVDFDVFRPGHRRRRTAAGVAVPDYLLVVVDVDSIPPCPIGVRNLQQQSCSSGGGVNVDLLFAIVDDGSVHYQVCTTSSIETIHYRF